MLFQPRRQQTEHVNHVWLRRYGATDLTAWVADRNVSFIDAVRYPREIFLGHEEAWLRGPVPLICGRRNRIYFAEPAQREP